MMKLHQLIIIGIILLLSLISVASWSAEVSCKGLFSAFSLRDLDLSKNERRWVNRTISDLGSNEIDLRNHLFSAFDYIAKERVTKDRHVALLFEVLFARLRSDLVAQQRISKSQISAVQISARLMAGLSASETIIRKGFLRYIDKIDGPSNSRRISLKTETRLFILKLTRNTAWRWVSSIAFFQPPDAALKPLPEGLLEAILLEGSDSHQLAIQAWAKANSNRATYNQVKSYLGRLVLGASALFFADVMYAGWNANVESAQEQTHSQLDSVERALDGFDNLWRLKKDESFKLKLRLNIEKFQQTYGRDPSPRELEIIRSLLT